MLSNQSNKVTYCKWKDCTFQCKETSELKHHLENDHLGKRKPSYTCEWEECNFGERKKIYDLKTHLAIHHRHPSHFCPNCSKGFSRDQELRKHRKSCSKALQSSQAPPQQPQLILQSTQQSVQYLEPSQFNLQPQNVLKQQQQQTPPSQENIFESLGIESLESLDSLDSIETLTSEYSSPSSLYSSPSAWINSNAQSLPHTPSSSLLSSPSSTSSSPSRISFLANQLLLETLKEEQEEDDDEHVGLQDLYSLKRQIDNEMLNSSKMMKYSTTNYNPSSSSSSSASSPPPSSPSTPFGSAFNDEIDPKPFQFDDYDEWFNKNPLFATLSSRRPSQRTNQRAPSHFGLKPSGFIKIFRTMKI